MDKIQPITVLTEDEKIFRDTVANFAKEKVALHVREMEKQKIIFPSILTDMFSMGLMGIEVPDTLGGSNGNFMMIPLAIQELSKVDPSIGGELDLHNSLFINTLLHAGNDEQQKRFLPLACKSKLGGFALTEPGAGSDALSLRTHAVKKGGVYIVNGRKQFISSAKEAETFILATTINPELGPKGITVFVLQKGMKGFSLGREELKTGLEAGSTGELVLEDCEIPAENLLKGEGQGARIILNTLNEGRIGIAAQMIGAAQGALDLTIKYCKERLQFGTSIINNQWIQFNIVELATEITLAETMLYNVARMKESGLSFLKEAAMIKLYSSQLAERVTSKCLHYHGGYGFTKEYLIEKFWRDVKVGQIYEGTNEMQMMTIAKALGLSA